MILDGSFTGFMTKRCVYLIDTYRSDVHRLFDAYESRIWKIRESEKYAALHDIYFMIEKVAEGCCGDKKDLIKFTVVDDGIDFDVVEDFIRCVAQDAGMTYVRIQKYFEESIQW
jgi:hypothetical protein